MSGKIKLHSHVGEVLQPESCDEEVADMMERLSRLQTWLELQCTSRRGDRDYLAAMRLVQDVRVLIVERCFRNPPPTKGTPHEPE